MKTLFIQQSPCIRTWKQANVLNDLGHEVYLAYNTNAIENYYNLPMNCFKEAFALNSYPTLFYISEYFDLIHCANESDLWTGFALVATHNKKTPVIHDCHDLLSSRNQLVPEQVLEEQMANVMTDHVIYCSERQRDMIHEFTGKQIANNTIIYNMPLEKYIPKITLPKIPKIIKRQKNKLNIVYAGGLSEQEMHHRNLYEHFLEILKQNHNLYVYAPIIPKKYEGLRGMTGWHPVGHVPYTEMIRELTRYDVGLIPFRAHMTNKAHLDMGMSNKLFEYLAAGLPILCRKGLYEHEKFVKENNVGIIYDSVQDMHIDPALYNIDRFKYTMDKEVKEKLIPIYEQLAAQNEYKKITVKNPLKKLDFRTSLEIYAEKEDEEKDIVPLYGMNHDGQKSVEFESWLKENNEKFIEYQKAQGIIQ